MPWRARSLGGVSQPHQGSRSCQGLPGVVELIEQLAGHLGDEFSRGEVERRRSQQGMCEGNPVDAALHGTDRLQLVEGNIRAGKQVDSDPTAAMHDVFSKSNHDSDSQCLGRQRGQTCPPRHLDRNRSGRCRGWWQQLTQRDRVGESVERQRVAATELHQTGDGSPIGDPRRDTPRQFDGFAIIERPKAHTPDDRFVHQT